MRIGKITGLKLEKGFKKRKGEHWIDFRLGDQLTTFSPYLPMDMYILALMHVALVRNNSTQLFKWSKVAARAIASTRESLGVKNDKNSQKR